MADRFTFAVVGHDEAASLPMSLAFAFGAAGASDRVWFVDSASTDGSAEVAAAMGAEVVDAPLGKGRAVATALARCDDDFLCLLDADIEESELNIPRRMREVALERRPDMLVGTYVEPTRRRSITPAIYVPLMETLFPDVLARDVTVALSGFRVLRMGLDLGTLPPGFGLETHLNIHVRLAGAVIDECEVGTFRGALRGYVNIPDMGHDVAAAVLDQAEVHGRLAHSARPGWDAWVAEALDLFRRQPAPGADDIAYLVELDRVAARARPPTR